MRADEGVVAQEGRMDQPTLRVLTLNVWNLCEPFAERMRLVRAGIEALQPDLIGLQEIIVRQDGFDQGRILFDGLPYHIVYGPASRFRSGHFLGHEEDGDAFGNLIASRWPLRRSEVTALPGEETNEYRSVTHALIDSPHGAIFFATTHLHWQAHHGYIRERQVVALADVVSEHSRASDFPAILVGDFNADPDSDEIRFLCGLTSLQGRSTYFQDTWRVAGDGTPGFTWDNRNPYAGMMFEPNRRLDYIFVGPADYLRNGRGWIDDVRVVMNESTNGVFPTDHFGVLAEVRI